MGGWVKSNFDPVFFYKILHGDLALSSFYLLLEFIFVTPKL